MLRWQDLKVWQKLSVVLLALIASMMMPELMFIMDLGGIELVFSFMVLYYQSIIAWFDKKITALKTVVFILHTQFNNSLLSRPRVLFSHAVYCITVFSFTSSLMFSMSFLTPAFFMGAGYL